MSIYRFKLLPILFGLLLSACNSSPPIITTPAVSIESTVDLANELLGRARLSSGLISVELSLQAIDLLLEQGDLSRAETAVIAVVNSINTTSTLNNLLPTQLKLLLVLSGAHIALENGEAENARQWLTESLVEQSDIDNNISREILQSYYASLGQAYEMLSQFDSAARTYIESTSRSRDRPTSEITNKIWDALTKLNNEDLDTFANDANSYELRGWIELARVTRADQFSIRSQLDSILQWQRIWARHSASENLPAALIDLQKVWDERPGHIALILPLQEAAGNAIQEGFFSAYYQALSISRDVPRISVYDSTDKLDIKPLYNSAVDDGAELIIGPLNKNLVNQLQSLPNLPVPTLALNYSDDTESIPIQLYQFGLAPEDEIAQAAEMAWKAGYRNAAIVTPQSSDYLRLQSIFSDLWTARGGELVSIATFSGDSDYAEVIKRLMAIDSSEARAERLLDILPRSNMEFTPRRRTDIEFIFLIANPRQGRQIKPTLAFYFAENIPVYSLPSIYSGTENQSENRDLDGIIFTDAPWLLSPSDPLKTEIAESLRQAQGPQQRLRAMGIDSFRLYPRLKQMTTRKIESLAGTTGTLRMEDNQRIHRILEIAEFKDGLAEIRE
jgi:outer membrane PBP1 activator LpoA protein